jgi:cyclopropane fatty-acyl-phospholipid synthase-like methyltransferase
MDLLAEIGQVKPGSRVLDVGCGLGGTGRYLVKAKEASEVIGITLSEQQVTSGTKLTQEASISAGRLSLMKLDAETIGSVDSLRSFDVAWICEALSHVSS